MKAEEGNYHVHALRDVREEVGNAPVLLDVIPGVGLQSVHHVRELDAIANEEHLNTHPTLLTLKYACAA
jgi:hypothetical protein